MTSSSSIRLLVLDLDNTLYDRVGFFVPSFYRMVDVACQILQVDHDVLLSELQRIHQQYGNSEQPYALLETDIVMTKYPNRTRAEKAKILDQAFYAFNKSRKELLKLFPFVDEVLDQIRGSGCSIVA